jgi:hypothetical protein
MNRAPLPLLLLSGVLLAGCDTGSVASPTTSPTTSGTVSSCQVVDGRADAHCTPGALNPDVSQGTIRNTICVPGWTATVRPPVSFTNPLKRQQMTAYGEVGSPRDYEEDHVEPLELGGAPADPRNLWPEPRSGQHAAAEKDREENDLHAAVCAGRMTLTDAQAKIRTDWIR